MLRQAKRIYRDDFELLHEGMQRFARLRRWEVIERPLEPSEEEAPDPGLVTLEMLGLERLRPVPEPIEEPPETVDDDWGEDDRSSAEVAAVEVQSVLSLDDEDDEDGEDGDEDDGEAGEAGEDDDGEANNEQPDER